MDMKAIFYKHWGEVVLWLRETVFISSFFVQLSVIIAAILIGLRAVRPLHGYFSKYYGNLTATHYIRRLGEKPVKYRITLFTILLFQLLSLLLMVSLNHPVPLILITTKLFSAWVLISLVLLVSGNSAFTRFFSFIVWAIAALSIVGILDSTIATLNAIEFSIGSIEINVFSIVTGVLTLIILIYGAGKLSKLLDSRIEHVTNLTPSARVLVKKVSKVFLLTLAFMIGLNSMGIDLTALAVFGGALGLGVGFGLQKVVSNLFSGFILLLDRSIKPGDVIQIDNTFGWVNSLGTRCVSILTRDGVEYLVPNEHLITETVTNWSYSSNKVRQKIPIGISYNADLRKAIELIVDVAKQHKRVLDDPTPVCRVIAFGDSSIELELRIWICDPIEGVMNIRSDILLGIWDVFKENNIEIPFPQRDVNLKPSDELRELIKDLK
ncbi:MAG: mechanosensitive ion channel protein MscS [Alphaproteobacteria bacterium CG11_big_fil_rev_8_21_14_0_20_39_49]|nr:MAG: mechanosensitive ion channel protein MscS [Alphaproteobacteria bacterium CG11_big_fil_rev_8_21_14_0_20_39_49]